MACCPRGKTVKGSPLHPQPLYPLDLREPSCVSGSVLIMGEDCWGWGGAILERGTPRECGNTHPAPWCRPVQRFSPPHPTSVYPFRTWSRENPAGGLTTPPPLALCQNHFRYPEVGGHAPTQWGSWGLPHPPKPWLTSSQQWASACPPPPLQPGRGGETQVLGVGRHTLGGLHTLTFLVGETHPPPKISCTV